MKQAFVFSTALAGICLILAAVVLGGYLTLSASAPATKANAQANQKQSCEQILNLLADQAQIGACRNMPDSSACYGHQRVDYEPVVNDPLVFNAPGDKEMLKKLKMISTSPLDLASGDWGVALLQTGVLANGQRLTAEPVVFLLYGATTIENNSALTAAPQNSAHPEGMHTFYFDTRGLGLTRECRDLPVGGVAIESPDNFTVTFTANEAQITIGSTVILQAVPHVDMRVTVLEGHAEVTAAGTTVTAVAGQEAIIPLGGTNGLQANKVPQVREANTTALAVPNLCQIAAQGGMHMPCSVTAVPTATQTFTPYPAPPATVTPSPVPSPLGPYVTANVNSNVRTGDDVVYPIMGALIAEQTAPVLGLSCTGSGWYYIQVNGRQGFVSNVIVTLTGSIAGLPCYNPPPRPTPVDSDGDGFIDAVDKCPYIYAPRSYDGCPLPTVTPTATFTPEPTSTPKLLLLSDLAIALPDNMPVLDCPEKTPSQTLMMRQVDTRCRLLLNIQVRNVSSGPAIQNFKVTLSAFNEVYWSTVVYGLAGNGEVWLEAALPPTLCYHGGCTITAVVDSDNTVPELNKANNSVTKTYLG